MLCKFDDDLTKRMLVKTQAVKWTATERRPNTDHLKMGIFAVTCVNLKKASSIYKFILSNTRFNIISVINLLGIPLLDSHLP